MEPRVSLRVGLIIGKVAIRSTVRLSVSCIWWIAMQMAVCVSALLVLVMCVFAFIWLGKSEAVEWASLVIVSWVWRKVRYWPGCWVRMLFVARPEFRTSDVVADMKRSSLFLLYW